MAKNFYFRIKIENCRAAWLLVARHFVDLYTEKEFFCATKSLRRWLHYNTVS